MSAPAPPKGIRICFLRLIYQYYLKSDLIKMKRIDLKETKNGYPISWAKSSDEVPNSPQ